MRSCVLLFIDHIVYCILYGRINLCCNENILIALKTSALAQSMVDLSHDNLIPLSGKPYG